MVSQGYLGPKTHPYEQQCPRHNGRVFPFFPLPSSFVPGHHKGATSPVGSLRNQSPVHIGGGYVGVCLVTDASYRFRICVTDIRASGQLDRTGWTGQDVLGREDETTTLHGNEQLTPGPSLGRTNLAIDESTDSLFDHQKGFRFQS